MSRRYYEHPPGLGVVQGGEEGGNSSPHAFITVAQMRSVRTALEKELASTRELLSSLDREKVARPRLSLLPLSSAAVFLTFWSLWLCPWVQTQGLMQSTLAQQADRMQELRERNRWPPLVATTPPINHHPLLLSPL